MLKAICARRAHNFVYFEQAILRSSYLIYYWYTNKIFWEGNFAKLLSGSSNQWVRGLRAVWSQMQVSNYFSTYLIAQLHIFALGLGFLLFIYTLIMLKMLQDNTLDSALQSPSGASKEQSHSIKSSTLPDRQELFASWDKLAGSSKANPVLIVRL